MTLKSTSEGDLEKPGREDTMIFPRFAAALASCLVLVLPARGEDMLRIAMTASDIPTTDRNAQ